MLKIWYWYKELSENIGSKSSLKRIKSNLLVHMLVKGITLLNWFIHDCNPQYSRNIIWFLWVNILQSVVKKENISTWRLLNIFVCNSIEKEVLIFCLHIDYNIQLSISIAYIIWLTYIYTHIYIFFFLLRVNFITDNEIL